MSPSAGNGNERDIGKADFLNRMAKGPNMSHFGFRRRAKGKSPTPSRDRFPRAGRRRTFRPHLEVLEDRTLLSTLLVTTTADSGPGSLRQAILNANANPGLDTIDFNIAPGGVQTIQPLSV